MVNRKQRRALMPRPTAKIGGWLTPTPKSPIGEITATPATRAPKPARLGGKDNNPLGIGKPLPKDAYPEVPREVFGRHVQTVGRAIRPGHKHPGDTQNLATEPLGAGVSRILSRGLKRPVRYPFGG